MFRDREGFRGCFACPAECTPVRGLCRCQADLLTGACFETRCARGDTQPVFLPPRLRAVRLCAGFSCGFQLRVRPVQTLRGGANSPGCRRFDFEKLRGPRCAAIAVWSPVLTRAVGTRGVARHLCDAGARRD
eukprot:7998-Chlamydomonas_euryale.AAC.3